MRQRALRNILLVGAALSTLAAPALADSYYFRTKPDVSMPAQAFSFAPQADQNPGATVTSAIASVKGYKGKSISVSGDAGAAYQVCSAADCSDQGANWKTAATSGLPESFYARARITASGTFLGTATATVTVGGLQSPFAATTRAKDEAPDAISFASKTGVAGSSVDSDIVQLRNHDGVTVSVAGTNATFRVCADATCSTSPPFDAVGKAVANNAWVQIRQTAPAAGQSPQVANLRYGVQSGAPIEAVFGVTGTAAGSPSVASMGISDPSLREALAAALGDTKWTQCSYSTCNGASALLFVYTNTASGYEFGFMTRTNPFQLNSGWVRAKGFHFSNAPGRTAYVFDDAGTPTNSGDACVYGQNGYNITIALSVGDIKYRDVGGYLNDGGTAECLWKGKFVVSGATSGASVTTVNKVYRLN